MALLNLGLNWVIRRDSVADEWDSQILQLSHLEFMVEFGRIYSFSCVMILISFSLTAHQLQILDSFFSFFSFIFFHSFSSFLSSFLPSFLPSFPGSSPPPFLTSFLSSSLPFFQILIFIYFGIIFLKTLIVIPLTTRFSSEHQIVVSPPLFYCFV